MNLTDIVDGLKPVYKMASGNAADDEMMAGFDNAMALVKKYIPEGDPLKASWSEMIDRANKSQEEEDTEDKNKGQHGLCIPDEDYKFVEKKLQTKPSCWRKFANDPYRTIFRKKDGKIMAYDPDFPQGRVVSNHESILKPTNPEHKITTCSPRGWLMNLIDECHPYLDNDRKCALANETDLHLNKHTSHGAVTALCYMLQAAFYRLTAKHNCRLDLYAPTSNEIGLLWREHPDPLVLKDLIRMHFHCFA